MHILRIVIIASCIQLITLKAFAASEESLANNGLGIVLASSGLALSVASLPSPIINFVGWVNQDDRQRIYGGYIGPGMNIAGGILTCVGMAVLTNNVNPYGEYNEIGKKRHTVGGLVKLGCALSVMNIVGQILFYQNGLANEFTYTLTIPVAFVAETLNIVAGAKGLVQNIRHRKGLKE